MSILRPQKILFSNLRKIDNLLDELSKSRELDNIAIANYKDENIEFTDLKVDKAIINNVEITNGNLSNNTFIDIEFNNCNFSNTSFGNSSFKSC